MKKQPVDLERFAGMTPGKWAYTEVQCIPAVSLSYDPKKRERGFTRIATCKESDTGLDTVPNFKAIAMLPDIIADLKATREDNRKLLAIIRKLNTIDCYATSEECEECKYHYADACPFSEALEIVETLEVNK